MGYLSFSNFKPIKGSVPFRHFDQLSSITWRARNLLEKRTDDQVETMASVVDDMIEDYFRTAKEEEIERLKSEGKYEYLEGDEDGNAIDIKSSAEGELDYPTAENTREVDALAMIVGTWSGIFCDGTPEPLDHEYFASLALAKIGEIINSLEYTYDYKTRKFEKRDPQKVVESFSNRRAAEKAIEAMEAVVMAENIRETSRLESRYKRLLDEAKEHASAAQRKHIDEEIQAAIEDFKNRQKEEHRNNGRLAHKGLESHKVLVLEDWEKDPSAHRSADRAAVFYIDWLKEVHGVEKDYQPRTVSKWIREYARTKGIRLR
jgi:chemotaxis protein histidine kinase CheA